MSQWTCEVEGCEKGIATGHALHRVNPKGEGQGFIGRCTEHFKGQPDPVAVIIEEDNRAR